MIVHYDVRVLSFISVFLSVNDDNILPGESLEKR
jgi:hypothetical protein